ncbi:hypothetical protein [Streptomyces sp. NPDC005141]
MSETSRVVEADAQDPFHEFQDAGARLDDEDLGRHRREAADALSTGEGAQEFDAIDQESRSGH